MMTNRARETDMRYINVIDLESTCWTGAPPQGETADIIEIGVAELCTQTWEVTRSRSIAVMPSRSTISPFCTELTGWTTAKLKDAGAFGDVRGAFEDLRQGFDARHRVWASWGAYDRNMIENVAADFAATLPVNRQHINVKTLFALAAKCRPCGMDMALAHLDWQLEGRHHRGVDDARNIARILAHLLKTLHI